MVELLSVLDLDKTPGLINYRMYCLVGMKMLCIDDITDIIGRSLYIGKYFKVRIARLVYFSL